MVEYATVLTTASRMTGRGKRKVSLIDNGVSCSRDGQKGNACRRERQSAGSRLNTGDAGEIVRVQFQSAAVQPPGSICSGSQHPE
jgi:hypothetical protein